MAPPPFGAGKFSARDQFVILNGAGIVMLSYQGGSEMKTSWGTTTIEVEKSAAGMSHTYFVVRLEEQANPSSLQVFERLEDARDYAEQHVGEDVDAARIFELALSAKITHDDDKAMRAAENIQSGQGKLVIIVAVA